MTNVTMKATDTLHVSSVGQHSLQAGEQFDVPTHVADDLEKRGLATRVGAAKEKPEPVAKAVVAAPANKMAAAPTNKTKA